MALKNGIKIITLLGIAISIAFFTLVFLFDSGSWEQLSTKQSPDGKYSLYLYNYNSDGDTHAPYGQYIFFHPEYKISNPIKSDVIFAGYCENISYTWVSITEIKIICKTQDTKNIRTQSNKIFGINVNVQTQ